MLTLGLHCGGWVRPMQGHLRGLLLLMRALPGHCYWQTEPQVQGCNCLGCCLAWQGGQWAGQGLAVMHPQSGQTCASTDCLAAWTENSYSTMQGFAASLLDACFQNIIGSSFQTHQKQRCSTAAIEQVLAAHRASRTNQHCLLLYQAGGCCCGKCLPANLLDDGQLVQVEGGGAASTIRQLHDVLSIFLNILTDIRHTQQLLH